MDYIIYRVKRGKFKGQYRFRLVADNGEVIIPVEQYHNKQDLKDTIKLIQNSSTAGIIDSTEAE